jgi:catechol-2,3-dioxygenase
MRKSVISAIGHVALQVDDLDAAVEHATTIMGLRVVESSSAQADLTHGAPHHSLQYIAAEENGFDHLGLEADGPEALQEIRDRLAKAGVPLLGDGPLDESLGEGIVFETPAGMIFEVYTGMPQDQPDYSGRGVRPRRFGHVNFSVEDPQEMITFCGDVLDFRISDHFRGGAFLRCNAEHHGMGMLKGRGVLHHYAWEVEGLADLGRLGDLVEELGDRLIAGPVRHGMGNNVAAYIEGPGGVAVEYYADMYKIWDESSYTPGHWSEDDPGWYTRWAPDLPGERFRGLGAHQAPGVRERAASKS